MSEKKRKSGSKDYNDEDTDRKERKEEKKARKKAEKVFLYFYQLILNVRTIVRYMIIYHHRLQKC